MIALFLSITTSRVRTSGINKISDIIPTNFVILHIDLDY